MPFDDCRTNGRKSRITYKHKRDLFLQHGVDIPSGMYVLHLCDNPSCDNWEHLILGTASQNSKQAYDSHRQKNCFESGEKHTNHKLSKADINKIITERRAGASQLELSQKYKVNQSQVSRILSGKRWGTVVRSV